MKTNIKQNYNKIYGKNKKQKKLNFISYKWK